MKQKAIPRRNPGAGRRVSRLSEATSLLVFTATAPVALIFAAVLVTRIVLAGLPPGGIPVSWAESDASIPGDAARNLSGTALVSEPVFLKPGAYSLVFRYSRPDAPVSSAADASALENAETLHLRVSWKPAGEKSPVAPEVLLNTLVETRRMRDGGETAVLFETPGEGGVCVEFRGSGKVSSARVSLPAAVFPEAARALWFPAPAADAFLVPERHRIRSLLRHCRGAGSGGERFIRPFPSHSSPPEDSPVIIVYDLDNPVERAAFSEATDIPNANEFLGDGYLLRTEAAVARLGCGTRRGFLSGVGALDKLTVASSNGRGRFLAAEILVKRPEGERIVNLSEERAKWLMKDPARIPGFVAMTTASAFLVPDSPQMSERYRWGSEAWTQAKETCVLCGVKWIPLAALADLDAAALKKVPVAVRANAVEEITLLRGTEWVRIGEKRLPVFPGRPFVVELVDEPLVPLEIGRDVQLIIPRRGDPGNTGFWVRRAMSGAVPDGAELLCKYHAKNTGAVLRLWPCSLHSNTAARVIRNVLFRRMRETGITVVALKIPPFLPSGAIDPLELSSGYSQKRLWARRLDILAQPPDEWVEPYAIALFVTPPGSCSGGGAPPTIFENLPDWLSQKAAAGLWVINAARPAVANSIPVSPEILSCRPLSTDETAPGAPPSPLKQGKSAGVEELRH